MVTGDPLAGPDASHGYILYIEDITVSFDGFKALNALTLYIETGELRCIIGPNGAGKTTMMDVITGKTRPDYGSAWFGQTIDLLAHTEPEIAQAGIGRKFQKPTVFAQHTVFENLELSMAGDKSVWHGLFARLSSAERERIDEVLETIGLEECRYMRAGALVAWPETVAGDRDAAHAGTAAAARRRACRRNDSAETERTAELLTSLAGEHSVVVVEHDMDFVRSIAKKVTVLHEGRVLAEGNIDQVQSDPKVIEVYLGE